MTKKITKGTLIGILDIHGNEIANGDKIKVQILGNLGTRKEKVKEEFEATIEYNSYIASFLMKREKDYDSYDEENSYVFNRGSQRYEILDE